MKLWFVNSFFLAFCISSLIVFSVSAQYSPPGFKTPSGNIICVVTGDVLRCDMKQIDSSIPQQPSDCLYDWGNAFGLPKKGKAARLCYSDTVTLLDVKVLPYGKTWAYNGFSCSSAMNGLTCRNSAKKGWFLNREVQKFF